MSDLIIGIEFGTSFTGVAYAHTGTYAGNDIRRITDRVMIIKSWPSSIGHFAEKIPTIISYNTNPPNWGETVKPQHQPQVSHFILGLQPHVGLQYFSLASMRSFLGVNRKIPGKTAVDFAADYLTCVHRHVMGVCIPHMYGSEFLKHQQVSYVITVPSVWTDSAKALTRQAAVRAGIPERNLDLITEPEAAAFYCAAICCEVDLNHGDHFLLCDAPGEIVVHSPMHSV